MVNLNEKEHYRRVEVELHEGEGQWYEAVILGKTMDGKLTVVEWADDAIPKHCVDAVPLSRIRPIQSAEQRQFDEIMDAIKPPGGWPFLTLSDIEETVEAILSKYELKERK